MFSYRLFSVSLEVYFIVAFIGILIFIPLQFLIGKFTKNPKRRVIITIFGTIILAPIVYICLVIALILANTYYLDKSFNREKWFATEDERYTMSKDIINSKLLNGKTKKEVIEILGEEKYNEIQSDKWAYNLGFVPGIGNIDPVFLVIYFENDKVVKVEQYQS